MFYFNCACSSNGSELGLWCDMMVFDNLGLFMLGEAILIKAQLYII